MVVIELMITEQMGKAGGSYNRPKIQVGITVEHVTWPHQRVTPNGLITSSRLKFWTMLLHFGQLQDTVVSNLKRVA